ncbi:MAG: response regulator transcription factor [Symploca sp. SIO1B1]|nr:response regulator transcription factor [Symploca sp. SIO2D2]NER19703.1 response regulator transcription factor [Symploca sp. SIO1C2]NER94069.1 response regulator transcription factor [Symploca sp. SIO1B1]
MGKLLFKNWEQVKCKNFHRRGNRVPENIFSDTKQLLLVDDDPNLILLVQDYLEFQGYTVITATNGLEALSLLEDNIPDLIICDIMMPEMDGYTVVEQIRQNPRINWIPVLVLSAKGQTQERIKGLNTGANVYMVKPFEPEELVAVVESSLKQTERFIERGRPEPEPIRKIHTTIELTRAELKVIHLLAQGMANREIAKNLKVSQRTIETHVSNMLSKTRLHNRTELARWAMDNRIA